MPKGVVPFRPRFARMANTVSLPELDRDEPLACAVIPAAIPDVLRQAKGFAQMLGAAPRTAGHWRDTRAQKAATRHNDGEKLRL